jgi:hypothetical protein
MASPVATVVTTAQPLTASSSDPEVEINVSNLPGDGTESDPYEISNASELQAIEDDLDAHYELVTDINASGTAQWNDNRGFDPIGSTDGFAGSLDGNSHTVTELTIRRSTEKIGLFGVIGSAATVTNLSLTAVALTGKSSVGGVAGESSGTVRTLSVTGTVDGTQNVGGIVGENGGNISHILANVSTTGSKRVGGIVGNNQLGSSQGSIQSTIVVGEVHGDDDVGGVVGHAQSGTIRKSYWDKQATTQSPPGKGIGLLTAQMQGQAAEQNMTKLAFGETWRTTPGGYPDACDNSCTE